MSREGRILPTEVTSHVNKFGEWLNVLYWKCHM